MHLRNLKIRHYALIIILCCALFYSIRFVYVYFSEWTFSYGANTSVLAPGELVVLVDWEGVDLPREFSLNTVFAVLDDPTDEDVLPIHIEKSAFGLQPVRE